MHLQGPFFIKKCAFFFTWSRVKIKKVAILISLLAPLGVLAADLDSQVLKNPPYKKRAISTLVDPAALPNAKQLDLSSYIATLYYTSIQEGAVSNANAGDPSIPSPVLGAVPVQVVRSGAWVGRVRWREINVDGSFGGSPELFKSNTHYVAQINWTLKPASPSASTNVLQMAKGAYREGSYAKSEQSQNLSSQNHASSNLPALREVVLMPGDKEGEPAKASVSVKDGYASLATNTLTHQPKNSAREILLPDLGDDKKDLEPAPVKKPYDAAQQGYSGAQTGTPYGSPGSTLSVGNPNSNGGQAPSNQNGLPGANTGLNQGRSPSVILGDAGIGANISPTTTNFHYESKSYLAHVGVDYISPKSNYGLGIKADGAALLTKTSAIGTNLSLNNNNKEAVLSGVWMPEDTHLKAKLSASYMWGQQDFGFYSGTSGANLTQASYYFSTQYVVPKEQSDYLHSAGISTWGSRARQTNNPDPVYSVVNTASSYQIMMDPRKLAVGTLQGESLDAQLGITKQVIAKVSAGYESLKFPFSDGTQELDKRIYQDYVVQYQPIQEVALQAGYKMGAAMNNIMLSAAYGQWRLTGFKNNGVNGVAGNQGILLGYSFPLDGKTKSVALGTLIRPELVGNSSYILRDAATRPVQLPQAFLAKVDTTAVKTVATINKLGLPNGVTVNAAGDLLIAVGVGAASITQVTRNGSAYAFNSVMQVAGTNVQIHSKLLPAATSSGDVYVITATDTASTPYLITINTAN